MIQNSKQIVIVEDEEEIRELIEFHLQRDGFTVLCAESGEQGLRLIRRKHPDLVVLDLMLPDVDGLTICRKLKSDSETRAIPVVMLTARSEEADMVAGLELGADDYITKPFSPRVLIARIRATLRSYDTTPHDYQSVIRRNDWTLHPGRHEITYQDRAINATPTEFRILQTLMLRPGWVFSRDQIADAIHGGELVATERTIDVHIASLRKKLGDASRWIETVRGVGYRFREEA